MNTFELWATGTLTNHWQRMCRFLRWHRDTALHQIRARPPLPIKMDVVVAYLDDLETMKVGASTPFASLDTFRFVHKALGIVTDADWKSPLIMGFAKRYHKSMVKEAKQAPAMSVDLSVACEEIVNRASDSTDRGLILVLGTFMFMVVASMRFDDALHVLPNTIHRTDVNLKKGEINLAIWRGKASKTKTDQSGMKSYFVVSEFNMQYPWMEKFMDVYWKCFVPDRDYFIMDWRVDKDGFIRIDPRKPGTYGGTLETIRAVLSKCLGHTQEGADFAANMSWHSARCSMIQWGADQLAEPNELIKLMRSKTVAMSNTYTRDHTVATALLQRRIQENNRKKILEKQLGPAAEPGTSLPELKGGPQTPFGLSKVEWSGNRSLQCHKCKKPFNHVASLMRHMHSCKAAWDELPEEEPCDEYVWHCVKGVAHLQSPLRADVSACLSVRDIYSFELCCIRDFSFDKICVRCIGAVPASADCLTTTLQ